MEKINWTNCADEMPPEEKIKIILNIGIRYYLAYSIDLFNSRKLYGPIGRIRWTSYTPEKWEELNNGRDK